MRPFLYTGQPARVLFGQGTLSELSKEIARLERRRVLVLVTPQQHEQGEALSKQLGNLSAGVFAGAVMHTPVSVTETAMAIMEERDVDGLVALGGGSTIGLSKALAYRTNLPQIAIPTTYAGSEMTPILGQTQDGEKKTLKAASVLPQVVIYDVDLTRTLPVPLSGVSGMNAVAHAIEATYAQESNPIISLLAIEGIRSLARALPTITARPQDIEARSDALYGAWLCGLCLGSVGMALHHKLCHTLGGAFELPHAETHTVVLPHAVAYNAPFAEGAMRDVAGALGNASSASQALYDLARSLGLHLSLKGLGMSEDQIEPALDLAMANSYWNPAPIERGKVRDLLGDAFSGRRPRI